MTAHFSETPANGRLNLIVKEEESEKMFFRDRRESLLTIAWNTGPAQRIILDEANLTFPAHSILPLMFNQSFRFERPGDVIAWQFNREFYCILTHDQEVSCVGFLFYGSSETMFITLDPPEQRKFKWLLLVFLDEMSTRDTLQVEMLRLLLKRLIVKVTRLARQQYAHGNNPQNKRIELIRGYNLLVENHYRRQHQVQFYARQLNRSTKTLSNLFAIHHHKSPRQIIHDRLMREAKRLFYYTDKSAKEVAHEIGFESPAHFSRFFKKQGGLTPTAFKKNRADTLQGNN
ncbi:MAG: helix-turn-helix domain-containing protein [Ferruginibacter sp.]|nr:helix-turn-helix domain-containing protein [Cytophagales bacterium]